MLTFFTSKPKTLRVDFSNLRADIHSHILPGIDDGARNVAQSIELVETLVDLGYKKLIATPHIKSDYYPNTHETISTALSILNTALDKKGIEIDIEAAAEYYLDETFEAKLENGDILAISGKYILFELSFYSFPLNLFEVINKIKSNGYTPILAHPERYPYLCGSVDNFFKIRESGCLLQLNTISLTGYFGKPAQRIAEDLVNNSLIDFAGSDMHHLRHAEALKQSAYLPSVERLLDRCNLQNTLL